MKPFLVAANWKMYKSPSEAVDFLKNFVARTQDLPPERKVVFFVPAIDLWVTQQVLRGTQIEWGAQNCHYEKQGAFTGENSPAVLAELLTGHCLVGHSERRSLFGETDAVLAKKMKTLSEVGVQPMLCVGETLADREANRTDQVITEQLAQGLSLMDLTKPFTLAYEPVWAIGTGKVASPEQAEDAHLVLRKKLSEILGTVKATSTPILYGGSVKPDNAELLFQKPNINGFLIGGASLQIESMLTLAAVGLASR